jgi:hypothetical protein
MQNLQKKKSNVKERKKKKREKEKKGRAEFCKKRKENFFDFLTLIKIIIIIGTNLKSYAP